MKVIDLLNKIAKGEEAPKKIVINDIEWIYDGIDYARESDGEYLFSVFVETTQHDLNVEIEIIEEDKEITKWGKGALEEIQTKKDYKINDLQKYIEILMETQNQIIDRLNELKKGE